MTRVVLDPVDPIPAGAPVLVAWQNSVVLRGRVECLYGECRGRRHYLVSVNSGRDSAHVWEEALTDLTGLDRPACAFAMEGGRA